MELYSINTGNFKLDGGAMFGVVPKVIWQKVYPADENNLCTWSLRCLLVVTDNRRILIDCGIGDKQDEKFFKNYHLSESKNLVSVLNEKGFAANSITDVVLTHLHFDHCGGAVSYNNDKTIFEPTFKNAVYWVSNSQWALANHPNNREKASYFKENFVPVFERNQLQFIDCDKTICPGVELKIYNGHTAGQLIPYIIYKGRTLVYMADFIPATAHLPLPFVISYDTQPLVTLDEKAKFLQEAVKNDYVLFFEHDYYHECCDLQETEKGVRAKNYFTLLEFINK